MAAKRSAGLLVFRRATSRELQVLLAHMGGPLWERKDVGAWSIPKGEHDERDDPLAAARREFVEELCHEVPEGELIDLGEVRQPSGKRVRVWAVQGDLDASHITSNTFEMEWPPRSGRRQRFVEVDRAGWFDLGTARAKLVPGQTPFLARLSAHLGLGDHAAA
jgi:predicted NUDIX family NTP pyrophosphohydrolase